MSLFDGRKKDLKDEIESHLRMAAADRVAAGETPEDARREAMREFGNVPLVADVTRERWGWLRWRAWCRMCASRCGSCGRRRGLPLLRC